MAEEKRPLGNATAIDFEIIRLLVKLGIGLSAVRTSFEAMAKEPGFPIEKKLGMAAELVKKHEDDFFETLNKFLDRLGDERSDG